MKPRTNEATYWFDSYHEERALADDLAAVLAKIYFPGIFWQDEQEAVLARYREARR
jgi:hypothetical protein